MSRYLEPTLPAHIYWWRSRQVLLWLNHQGGYTYQDGDQLVERLSLPGDVVELETCDCDDCAMKAA